MQFLILFYILFFNDIKNSYIHQNEFLKITVQYFSEVVTTLKLSDSFAVLEWNKKTVIMYLINKLYMLLIIDIKIVSSLHPIITYNLFFK